MLPLATLGWVTMHKLRSDHHTGRDTFWECTPTRSRHLKVQLRESIVESNRIFSLLLDEILYKSCTNSRVDGLEEVRNLRSREFNVLRLEDLYSNDEGEARLSPGQADGPNAPQKRCFGLAEKPI